MPFQLGWDAVVIKMDIVNNPRGTHPRFSFADAYEIFAMVREFSREWKDHDFIPTFDLELRLLSGKSWKGNLSVLAESSRETFPDDDLARRGGLDLFNVDDQIVSRD